MECAKIRAILFECTDAEIPAEFREEVRAHLAACEPCAALFAALEEQSDALRTIPRLAAPANLLGNVRSRLEKPSLFSILNHRLHAFFGKKRFFRLAGAAAAAMLLILSVRVVFRQGANREVLLSRAPSAVTAPPPAAKSFAPSAVPSPPPPVRAASRPAGSGTHGVAKHGPYASRNQTPVLALVLKMPAGGDIRGGSPAGRAAQSLMREAARPALAPRATGLTRSRRIISEVTRLVERANGKMLNSLASGREIPPGTLLAEIPEPNFRSFLAGMRKLGEVELSGAGQFGSAPNTKVRVSISLEKK